MKTSPAVAPIKHREQRAEQPYSATASSEKPAQRSAGFLATPDGLDSARTCPVREQVGRLTLRESLVRGLPRGGPAGVSSMGAAAGSAGSAAG
jgi:hypothetical protein